MLGVQPSSIKQIRDQSSKRVVVLGVQACRQLRPSRGRHWLERDRGCRFELLEQKPIAYGLFLVNKIEGVCVAR